MKDYSVVIERSSRELSVKEKIQLTQNDNFVSLDKVVTENQPLVIKPKFYAVLNIHNERSKGEKDFMNYIIQADDGTYYKTGSNSFMESFEDIFTAMEPTGEAYEVEILKRPSKNYEGKYFLSCNIR